MNLAFQRIVNSVLITRTSAAGTALILVGTAVAVVAGPRADNLVASLQTLESFWNAPGWIVLVLCVLGLAAAAELVRHRIDARMAAAGAAAAPEGAPAAHAATASTATEALALPLSFAMPSALIGAQMQVQSKSVAEAIKLVTVGQASAVLRSWFLYGSCTSP